MSKELRIESAGGPNRRPNYRIMLNGVEIGKQVTRLTLNLSAGQIATAEITLVALNTDLNVTIDDVDVVALLAESDPVAHYVGDHPDRCTAESHEMFIDEAVTRCALVKGHTGWHESHSGVQFRERT